MTDRNDALWSPVSRRQALAGLGTLATGAGVVGVSSLTAEHVRAQVTVENFAVADAEFTATAADPRVVVDVGYDYSVGETVVSAVMLRLSVDGTEVASDELVTDRTTLRGSSEIRGAITDSDEWDSDDFAPAVAESVTREVSVTVDMAILDDADSARWSATPPPTPRRLRSRIPSRVSTSRRSAATGEL